MIYTESDARHFLESSDGRVLMRVRAERDVLGRLIVLLSSTSKAEEWVEDLVRMQCANSACHALIEHFSGNRNWTCCQRVEAFFLLCERVGQLERELTTQPA